MKLSCYKHRVGKRGTKRELDTGLNWESLASRKSGEKILLLLYFIFVPLLFSITNSNTLRNMIQLLPYLLFYCYYYQILLQLVSDSLSEIQTCESGIQTCEWLPHAAEERWRNLLKG